MPETIVSVDDLENKLKDAITNRKVSLTDLSLLSNEIRQMLLNINRLEEIIVDSSKVTRQEEVVILKGTVTLLGLSQLDATINFKLVEGKVEIIADIHEAEVHHSISVSLGITEVDLTDIGIKIYELTEGTRKAVLSGKISIEEQTIQLTLDLLGDGLFQGQIISLSLQKLISTLCGRRINFPGIPDLTIQDAHFTIGSPSEGSPVTLTSNVQEFGILQLIVSKYDDSWEFIAVLSLGNEWKLSRISEIFSVFDFLKFVEPRITLSSVSDSNVTLIRDNSQTEVISVIEGVYFSGKLQMEGLGLDIFRYLFQIPELPIGGVIAPNLSSTRFRASLDDELSLFGITFEDVGLDLQPQPFLISFHLSTIVYIQNEELPFSGSIQLQQNGVAFQLAMRGIWEKPFGLPMFDIENVVLEFQTSPDPRLAVKGCIRIEDNQQLEVICRFTSSGVPDVLIGNLQGEINTSTLIQQFTGIDMPEGFLDVSIMDVRVYIVASPQGAPIDEIQYPFGFRFHGKIHAYGVESSAKVSINENGIYLDGQSDPINVGDVLKIYGETSEQGPKVVLRAIAGEPFLFQLDAGVQLLGATLETHILIKQDGLEFAFSSRIFNIFEANVEAKTTGELKQGDFYIRASMQNDMLEYMNNAVRQNLQERVASIEGGVSEAQANLENLERFLQTLNERIANRESQYDNERTSAKRLLEEAKNEERTIANELDDARRDLEDIVRLIERTLDPRELVRYKVIRDELKNLISRKKDELEAKKNLVRERRNLLESIVPPQADPTYIAMVAEKEPLEAAIQDARTILETVKRTAGKLAQVNQYIQSNNITAVFDVSRISFEGGIQSVGGGHVTLSMTVRFMGAEKNINHGFIFPDPMSGVHTLADSLIESLT
ncbi:hypothetical protein V7659_25010 [Neobacillus drentensis]|uniref:hypothetical protein n=1 Tax=Neobacillus drentensis TaxID=220684 RepID=UPI002FFEE924